MDITRTYLRQMLRGWDPNDYQMPEHWVRWHRRRPYIFRVFFDRVNGGYRVDPYREVWRAKK
jgi:hypothetical protein